MAKAKAKIVWTDMAHGICEAWRDDGKVGVAAQIRLMTEIPHGGGTPSARFRLELRRMVKTGRRTRQWEWDYLTFAAAEAEAEEALLSLELPKDEPPRPRRGA